MTDSLPLFQGVLRLKKFLIAFISITILCDISFGQETECSEIWQGNVILQGDFEQEEGCELIIMPGTVVNAEGHAIIINGSLHCVGTSDSLIQIHASSFLSRTTADQFVVQHTEVFEDYTTGAFAGINDYSPDLTGILEDARLNEANWFDFLDSLHFSHLFQNEFPKVGEYFENFDDNEFQGWTVYNKWNCSTYLSGTNSITTIDGILSCHAGSSCSGCGGFYGAVSPELPLLNVGERPSSISFFYRLNSTGTFGGGTLEYAINGASDVLGDWQYLASLPETGAEFHEVNFKLDIPSALESIRFRIKRSYGCVTGNASNSSSLEIDSFLVKTNYARTGNDTPFKDAVIRSVSSGGMTISDSHWTGGVSIACDNCSVTITRAEFEPYPDNHIGLAVIGEQNAVVIEDCSFNPGLHTDIHLDLGQNSEVNILRTHLFGPQSQGMFVGNGWAGEMNNVLISNSGDVGLRLNTDGEMVLNHSNVLNNDGAGIDFMGSGFLDITNSIIWGNNIGTFSQIESSGGLIHVSHSDLQGLLEYGVSGEGLVSYLEGNISSNPQFVNGTVYQLHGYSECVDAANIFELDAFRPPGIGGQRADIGLWGGQHLLSIGLEGCSDPSACNFDGDAVSDDNTCVYPITHYDCNGDCLTDNNQNLICDELELTTTIYEDGYAAGLAACQVDSNTTTPSMTSCGPGTYWDEFFELCLPEDDCLGDLNGDGFRGTVDLLLVLSFYGEGCP